jgi:flagellar hook protein FlgE
MVNEAATNPMRSYNIGADGVVTGIYADGTKKPLFQLAIANFANPEGLEKVGDTSFRESTNSGIVQLGAPGTGRRGDLIGGSLEMSNVDLAQEFTNLIIAQRGFQATSRVITTSDQVLEELVNIKR